jgi:8-oxo-dGTP pyrophosphatase MutT (NUDIX family)
MSAHSPAPGGSGDAPSSPWRTLAAHPVYRNPWLAVTEYDVIRPDGQRGIYGVVDPGRNASVLALDEQQRLYLVGEFIYPLQRFQWTIPTGRVEEDEEPELAAHRELAEEAGLEAARWELLGIYDLSPGISTQTASIFLARQLTPCPPRPEGTERITIRRVTLAEAVAACLSGEIRNAVSVIGILRLWHELGQVPGESARL